MIQPLAAKFPGRPGKPSFADGRFHTFRHFFCSWFAQKGVPEVVMQGWLGHSSSTITRLYYHQNRKVSVDWMSRVNLDGSGEGSTPSCSDGSLVGGRTLKGRKNQVPSRGKAG
ncbi:MAG: tyrosine-type recombinase/integrase [Gemmataceae bacterium]